MTLPHLLRLPVELHLGVIDKLELRGRNNLAATSRYFRSIIKPPTHDDYLLAETSNWATNRCLFACKGCTRIREYTQFADDMRKGKFTRGGTEAKSRLCLDCGIVAGLYPIGAAVAVYGKAIVRCRACGRFPQHHTSRQTPCAKCSKTVGSPHASAASASRRQLTREHRTSRSSRVFSDINPDDELYGGWRDG